MSKEELRKLLDETDNKIVSLFIERMELVKDIALDKKTSGSGIRDPKREREILARVTDLSPEEIASYLKALYQTIFSLSRAYQSNIINRESKLIDLIKRALAETPDFFPKKATVACQGTEGSYSQLAADKLFSLPSILYFANFENVFQAVNDGLSCYGMLPIENSTSGSVPQVYDLMRKYKFHIARGVKIRVQHNLFMKKGERIEDLREIWSHPQALEQCSVFLKSLPNVKIHIADNTAMAAKMVSEYQGEGIGAIASSNCGDIYNLSPVKKDIENHGNNYTRFICISKELEIYEGSDKISLMFSVPHTPGALFDLLSKFAALDINVSKIESRPLPGTDFEFIFYFDLETSVKEEAVVKLMGELDNSLDNFQFLGCYGE